MPRKYCNNRSHSKQVSTNRKHTNSVARTTPKYSTSANKKYSSYKSTTLPNQRANSTSKQQKPTHTASEAYCYSLNLKNGKKYVGYTTNLNQRMKSHFSGQGAKATQKHTPVSINHIQKCTNTTNAKKAEQIVYKNMAKYHGKGNVRGAGNTNSHNF